MYLIKEASDWSGEFRGPIKAFKKTVDPDGKRKRPPFHHHRHIRTDDTGKRKEDRDVKRR